MRKQHWNTLVTSIRCGQCVLVLGPEIPAGILGAPDAVDVSFAEALTRDLKAELKEGRVCVTGTTLAAVAQQYEDERAFGPSALQAHAANFLKSPEFVPSQIHHDLAALPFSLILTTCQDHLIVDALQAAGKAPVVQRYHLRGDKRDNPEIFLPSSPQAPLVYHLFGDAQVNGSMVLSENDLLAFLVAVVAERPPLPNSLVRALKRANQNFLLVGFGITQWYLRVLLKVLVRVLELDRSGTTFATEPLRGLSEDDREQTVLFYERGTRIELEDAEPGAFLSALVERLAAEGGVPEQSAPIGPRPRVFISYAHEDRDLASRVFDALNKAEFEPWLDERDLDGGDEWDDRIREELDVTDFTLLLYSPALCRKTDGYVNKEIFLARERALSVRGRFLIPLRTADISTEDRIAELSRYQEMSLRPEHFNEDINEVIKSMGRDLQRRLR